MGRCASSVALAATATAVLAAGADAWAEQYLCRFGDTIRRVELRVDDPQERLPCQVVYWKDTEEPGRPRVLWHAQTDAGFCERKAQELVQQLEIGGFSCSAADGDGSAEAQAQSDDAAEATLPDAASNGRAEEGQPGADLQVLQALLQEAVARDLTKLRELTSQGSFDAQIAALGDLDGDGVEDAAVILTYTSGTERMQYLMAYMYRDASYVPVARVALTDPDEAGGVAEIEAIEDGAIRLQWGRGEPGEGRPDRTAFVVQDGKLVEVPIS